MNDFLIFNFAFEFKNIAKKYHCIVMSFENDVFISNNPLSTTIRHMSRVQNKIPRNQS